MRGGFRIADALKPPTSRGLVIPEEATKVMGRPADSVKEDNVNWNDLHTQGEQVRRLFVTGFIAFSLVALVGYSHVLINAFRFLSEYLPH
jgi:hypothetical protein